MELAMLSGADVAGDLEQSLHVVSNTCPMSMICTRSWRPNIMSQSLPIRPPLLTPHKALARSIVRGCFPPLAGAAFRTNRS